MALSVQAALDAMYVRDPNLRNVNSLPEAVQVVLGLADTGQGIPVANFATVQRVDTRKIDGTWITTYEVADRRKPKLTRIVSAGHATRAEALAVASARNGS